LGCLIEAPTRVEELSEGLPYDAPPPGTRGIVVPAMPGASIAQDRPAVIVRIDEFRSARMVSSYACGQKFASSSLTHGSSATSASTHTAAWRSRAAPLPAWRLVSVPRRAGRGRTTTVEDLGQPASHDPVRTRGGAGGAIVPCDAVVRDTRQRRGQEELSETCGPPTNRTSADGGPYVLPLGELYTGLPCRGVTAMKSASRWLTKRSPDCCTNSFTSSTANGSKMACEARACAAFDAHRRQTASVPFGRDPAEAVRRSVGRAPLAHGYQ
jgi:hypothetical protein